MSNKNDKKFYDQLKTVQGVAGISGVIGALMAVYAQATDKPELFRYTVAAVLGGLVWLKLFDIRRAKRQTTDFPKKVFTSQYTTGQRDAALMGLVALPLLAAVWILHSPPPPPPPECPPFKIFIAKFSTSGKFEDVRANLMYQIENRELEGIPLAVKRPDRIIGKKPKDESQLSRDEQIADARAYAKSVNGQMVIWAEAINDSTDDMVLNVTLGEKCHFAQNASPPGLTEVKQARQDSVSFRLGVTPTNPDHTQANAQDMNEFINLVMGIVLCEQNDWRGALSFLNNVQQQYAAYYRGRVYQELAKESNEEGYLTQAGKEYQSFFGPDWAFPPIPEIDTFEKKELAATAIVSYNNAGNVYFRLSELNDNQGVAYLKSSYTLYNNAFNLYGMIYKQLTTKKVDWLDASWETITRGNRAAAMSKLADIADPGQRAVWLAAAKSDLEAVEAELRQLNPRPEEWAAAKLNLGTLALDLSQPLANNQQRALMLGEAESAFRELLKPTGQTNTPYNQAEVQFNLGLVCKELARDASDADALKYLDEAKQLHRNASEVFTKGAYPSDWAQNTRALALVFIEQSHKQKDQAEDLLKRAIRMTEKVLKVYTCYPHPYDHALTKVNLAYALDHHPLDCALTKVNLAYALRELAKIVPNKQHDYLDEAVRLSRESEQVLRQAVDLSNQNSPVLLFPLDHAAAQHNLGDSCYELGCASTGLERTRLLNEAIQAYTDALSVWDRYVFQDDSNKTKEALAKAETALQSATPCS